MKRCLTCNRTFTDESLGFCIEDGSILVNHESPGSESQATAVFPNPPPTVQMPPPRATDRVAGAFSGSPPRPEPYGWANESAPVWIPPPPPPQPRVGQQQTLAVLSLILGLLSITFGWICFGGPVLGFFAAVLGIIALVQIKNNPAHYTGKAFALVGLITGGLVLLFTLAMVMFWLIMIIIAGISS